MELLEQVDTWGGEVRISKRQLRRRCLQRCCTGGFKFTITFEHYRAKQEGLRAVHHDLSNRKVIHLELEFPPLQVLTIVAVPLATSEVVETECWCNEPFQLLNHIILVHPDT